jgi:CheY-like chemotaxis protein
METSGKTAVVVVDDEPPIVEVVCVVLEEEGFRTVACHHGPAAFPCIQDQAPELVILDIQMPDVDGIEIFQQMRSDGATAQIPVIFFTANAHILEQRLPNYRALGAVLLPKPFDVSRLITLVEDVIRT